MKLMMKVLFISVILLIASCGQQSLNESVHLFNDKKIIYVFQDGKKLAIKGNEAINFRYFRYSLLLLSKDNDIISEKGDFRDNNLCSILAGSLKDRTYIVNLFPNIDMEKFLDEIKWDDTCINYNEISTPKSLDPTGLIDNKLIPIRSNYHDNLFLKKDGFVVFARENIERGYLLNEKNSKLKKLKININPDYFFL